jgi:hypothetical protein
MFAWDKCSSLLQKFANYGRKKLYNIGPSTGISYRLNAKEFALDILARL